jgi:ABC-type uncharacterized transport system involved in gliding motility auxiliary subunit
MSWDYKKLGAAGLVLAVVLFLALNIFSTAAIRNAQIDLTETGLYTLSDGTREVLADLKEPLTLRLFVSRDLLDASPGLGTYATRVQELMERYATLSNGKIRFELIDPRPFSKEEDRAVGFGLNGVPLADGGDMGYMGIAGTNTTDDRDVISFLQPGREQFLEYDLTRLIYNLAHPKKKVVGLVSSLPIDADPLKKYKPWRVIEQMKQFFEVRTMGFEPDIKDDIDVLMVVHPFGLSDQALYDIDQFIMRGGKTMVFVDPFAEEGSRSNQAMRLPPDMGSDFEKLFKAWGLSYTRDKVLGDLGSAQRVSAGVDDLGRPIITDYVGWITMRKDAMNANDVVTGELRILNLATVGFLEKAEDATIEIEPLITSTKSSAPIDADKFRRQPSPADILKAFTPDDKTYVIAARIRGTLKSAFPDGPPKKKKKDDDEKADDDKDAEKKEPAPHLAQSKMPANLIVVADTDILADAFWLQTQDFFGQQLVVPTANNADFVINALDNLSGSSALIGLRSRGLSNRPFLKLQEIQRAAEARFRDTEQQLVKELGVAEKKLKDLQTKDKAGGNAVLSPEQREAITKFRGEMVKIRGELREVQLKLREDIDTLDAWTRVINIGAMPVAVALIAIALALIRRQRSRRRHASKLT